MECRSAGSVVILVCSWVVPGAAIPLLLGCCALPHIGGATGKTAGLGLHGSPNGALVAEVVVPDTRAGRRLFLTAVPAQEHLHVLLRNRTERYVRILHPLYSPAGYHALTLEAIDPEGTVHVFSRKAPWRWDSRASGSFVEIAPGGVAIIDVYLCDSRWSGLPYHKKAPATPEAEQDASKHDDRSSDDDDAVEDTLDPGFEERWRLRAVYSVRISPALMEDLEPPEIDWGESHSPKQPSENEEDAPFWWTGTALSPYVEVVLTGRGNRDQSQSVP